MSTTPKATPKKGSQKNAPQKTPSPKGDLLKSLITSLILIALGVLLMLRPDFATDSVASAIGWILIVSGGILMAVSILNWEVMGLAELIIGIIATTVGIFIVIRPGCLAAAFGVLIGIFLCLISIANFVLSVRQRKAGKVFAPTLILGFVLLALALVLIFVPADLPNFLMRAIGVLMILCGLAGLVFRSKPFMTMNQKKKAHG